MQKIEFEVGADKKSVVFDNRFFFQLDCDIQGVMENPEIKERVLLQHYEGLTIQQMEEWKRLLVKKFLSDVDAESIDREIETYEIQAIDEINSKRELKNIIYPFSYTMRLSGNEQVDVFTASELPEHFPEKYCQIDKAVKLPNFSLHTRIMAALNLSETVIGLKHYFKEMIYCICPDAVFVNSETGDVKILIEKCIDMNSGGKRKYEYNFTPKQPGETGFEPMDEMELLRFLGYATFRLLCVGDPFDGIDTLIEYPYLTEKALKKMHQGNLHFVFAENENKYSEYTGQHTYARWKMLPSFLKRAYKQVFDSKSENLDEQWDLEKWLVQMRKLRDCLVYVNNQFKLCDPEGVNKILFMKINEFQIPAWSKKAIYWYHVDAPYDAQTNGLIAGINADGFLENRSQFQWVVEFDMKTFLVPPGHSVKLEERMKIQITNEAIVNIVSGIGG